VTSVYYLIGKTLGRYAVLEHIGHGGMSEVYRGRQVQLDRMVAIKVLHPFLADDEGFVVRFQREAQIVATLRHPNIVQVYDFDHSEELGLYYMVMEYIDGPTLKDRLVDGPIPAQEAASIAAAIADALDYAHQRSMIHRDIKPANIMFVDADQAVLTDFGIAKMLTLTGLTASGAMVGTPAYMAPEVGMGQPGTASSDLYSLGVVLYQMVTGRLPFDSESPMGLVLQHINDEPKRPSETTPTLPESLERVVLKSMAKTPEGRYASAREMAVALRQSMGLEPPVIITPPPAARGGEPLSDTQPLPEAASEAAPSQTPPAKGETPQPALSDAGSAVREAVFEGQSAGREPSGRLGRGHRLLRWALMPVSILVIALSGLVGANGGVMRLVRGALPAIVSTGFAFPTLDMEPTPLPDPSDTVEPSAEEPPSPTEPAAGREADCSPVVRVVKVVVEPETVVPPSVVLVANVFLRNAGECVWPAGLQLVHASGVTLTTQLALPIQALPAGEVLHLVLPLSAPATVGQYQSVWEVRDSLGALLRRDIKFAIEVREGAAWTPTPALPLAGGPEIPEPLAMEPPILLDWETDSLRVSWSGRAGLRASGGSGAYRYYQGGLNPVGLLPDGALLFQGRYCQDVPVTVWVVSGSEAVQWEGRIPFPAPELCP